MITLVTVTQSDFFASQKANVSFSYLDLAFKYALIPLSKELRSVCQIIPLQEIRDDFCHASVFVVQYSSLSSLTQVLHSVPFDRQFQSTDIRILDNVVDSKTIDVSVILNKSSAVHKWKSIEGLTEIVRSILYFFVVVGNSLITLTWSKENKSDILYICINMTSSRKSPCRITSSTVINITEILSLDKFESRCTTETIKVVGLSRQLKFLNNIYEANVKFKKSQRTSPVKCIQKVLLIGPPGCGKSTLVNSFAKSKKCGLIVIEGSQLSHVTPGESENILRSFFDEVRNRTREGEKDICIVHLDQIENICRKFKSAVSHLKRLSNQLFQILEMIDEIPGAIVIATTSDIHSVDPVLRRSARIQVEIYIGMPNEKERREILQLHSTNLKSSICKKIAACTPGYNGADLEFLVQCVKRLLERDCDPHRNEDDVFQMFNKCIRMHTPSSMRGGLGVVRLRDAEMSQLGGLDEIKSTLKYCIEWPLKHSAMFKRLGIPVPKGILLYGPPGCAKTSLACAIANTTNTNFLAVSAAELYSPYVGEAERNVVEIFHKARMNSPSILFIDEIDALVGNRNTTSINVQTKILSAFLTEMDGFENKIDWSVNNRTIDQDEESLEKEETEANNTVIVIAATNRPDKLDSALLRPGRFDKIICVKQPEKEDRLDILHAIIRNSKIPLSKGVDLTEIAEKCENFSGADLKNLMKEAGYMTLFEEGMSATQIKHEHILKSLNLVQPMGSKSSYGLEQHEAS